jgi:hypothetical protein
MWTFTFKETLSIKDTRSRWNHLLTLLRRNWTGLCGLRVFELHPKGHGLHVHLVTNRFVEVNRVRTLSAQAGWGRIHAQRIPKQRATYLAKYLSKQRPPCFKAWRLWAGFGKEWIWTRVADIEIRSAKSAVFKAVMRWPFGDAIPTYFQRKLVADALLNATIKHGWIPGLGPGAKPYRTCALHDLI